MKSPGVCRRLRRGQGKPLPIHRLAHDTEMRGLLIAVPKKRGNLRVRGLCGAEAGERSLPLVSTTLMRVVSLTRRLTAHSAVLGRARLMGSASSYRRLAPRWTASLLRKSG